MGINERGINESINETIGDARVGERQTKCFAYRRVYYSAVVKHFFYFLSIFLRCESQAKRTLHLKSPFLETSCSTVIPLYSGHPI